MRAFRRGTIAAVALGTGLLAAPIAATAALSSTAPAVPFAPPMKASSPVIPTVPTTPVTPAAPTVTAPTPASTTGSDFYTYAGHQPLSSLKPGTVLNTRTLSWPVSGSPLPITVVQLLFRSTDAQGHPIAAVTSVLEPPGPRQAGLVSYQSYYDSLSPKDGPSYYFSGASSQPLNDSELGTILPLVLQGYAVNVPDTEGPTADFAAGPEYGEVTLDSIRAASASPSTGVGATAKVGMLGYSGGAIATNWAAVLAPGYAPDVNARLVGATVGGVLVEPGHNLHYIDGSVVWAGVEPMALIGVARSYGIDFGPYLSQYGKSIVAKMQSAPITDVLGHYPGLTWAQLALPQYQTPEAVPTYVKHVNLLNLGTEPAPTIPMQIVQGAGGTTEGTSGNKPGIGPGDGVMIAGDVRTLARQWCASGIAVQYTQYDALSHVTAMAPWNAGAGQWLADRFAGKPAPSNCATIAAGNSLAPIAFASPSSPSTVPLPLGNAPLAPLAGPLNQPITPGLTPGAAISGILGLL